MVSVVDRELVSNGDGLNLKHKSFRPGVRPEEIVILIEFGSNWLEC